MNGRMSSVLTEIVIESSDPVRAAAFWSAALDWELREYEPGSIPWISASGDPDQHDLKLVFVRVPESREPRNRLFVNPSGRELLDEVGRLCELGATMAGDKRTAKTAPDTPWLTLVDPGGTGLTVLASRVD